MAITELGILKVEYGVSGFLAREALIIVLRESPLVNSLKTTKVQRSLPSKQKSFDWLATANVTLAKVNIEKVAQIKNAKACVDNFVNRLVI